jgi:hypothetical protein
MNRFYTGYKEEYKDVPKIYVVSISDFLDKYNVESKQKFKLVSNYLNNWLKNKISLNNNNGSNQIL